MQWLNDKFEQHQGFPRPDWQNIYKHVEQHHKDQDLDTLWNNIALSWVNRIEDTLRGDYKTHQSDNFILLTTADDNYTSLFLGFLERIRKKILSMLKNIASDEGYGKYVVLMFDDIDQYYAYLSHYYNEDGIYGLSSGIFIHQGYGHFALPYQELGYAEIISAHELTHALLSHLAIPTWLNEGLAVNIEHAITGTRPGMDERQFRRHLKFWGEQQIQDFWSGECFYRADEGQELSYQLAQFTVEALSKDYSAFIEFATTASYTDGGESAAIHVYKESLGNLISQYFGKGSWSPQPAIWKTPGSQVYPGTANITHETID